MFNAFKLTFASLVLAASAAAYEHPPLDPTCPEGTRPGVQVDYYQYNVPVEGFMNATKDFYELSWYAGASVNYTQGTDNTPGAIRAGSFFDGAYSFKEELVDYSFIQTSLYMRYITLEEVVMLGVQFHSYTEQFAFDSICGGKATAVFFSVNFCANDPLAGAALFHQARTDSLTKLSTSLGAVQFEGNCLPLAIS